MTVNREFQEIKEYQTYIFDFDGTLHESMHIYYPAFVAGYNYLVAEGHAVKKEFTFEEVAKWLGYNSQEMWDAFMPDLDIDIKNHVRQRVGQNMQALLKAGQGKLFEGIDALLTELKERGKTLVFLSNCGEGYMAVATEAFGLDQYFHQFFCSAQFEQAPKTEILKSLLPSLEGPILIIGDRFHDIEAGYANGLDTMACLYGYGQKEEFIHATYQVSSVDEMRKSLCAT